MPDSPEVRIARLDEVLKSALNRLDTISEAYAPTNKTVIENALKISDLQADLLEIRAEIVKQVERRERDVDDLERQVLACATGVGDLERRIEKARTTQEQKVREERTIRIRWIVGIVVSFVLVVLGAYLGTVFG